MTKARDTANLVATGVPNSLITLDAASYNAITPVYSSGIKQVRLGETTCTSGTDVRYKAVWANQSSGSKETQLHGIGINY